jgi:hypothetical protein
MQPAERKALDGAEIQGLIAEVAGRLAPSGEQHILVVVGGSLLAWQGLRETTEDVDSVHHIPAELRGVIQAIAVQRDLRLDWLNDNARWFIPVTFRLDSCDVLFEHPRLRVLGAPLRDVFIMKMYRANEADRGDMVRIWPRLDFTAAQDVVDAYYTAYPHVESDPYLSEFVVAIARRAGFEIS